MNNITRTLLSTFFGFLLLRKPQAMANQFSFNPANNIGSLSADNPNGFCDADNLSFFDPSLSLQSPELSLTKRNLDVINTSFAFESSAAKQYSCLDRISSLASHIHQNATQFFFRVKTQYYQAITEGDLPRGQKLIAARVDVNRKGRHGESPLLISIRKNNLALVKALISAGADVNVTLWGKPALIIALQKGYLDIAAKLIDAGADVNVDLWEKPALIIALQKGYLDIAAKLIDAGADVNVDLWGKPALIIALEKGYLDIAEKLIDTGADINCESRNYQSAFILAIEKESLEIVQKLIDAGVDVNQKGRHGESPLLISVRKNNLALVEALISAEADVNYIISPDNPRINLSLLLIAIKNGNLKIIKVLLEAGANVNYVNYEHGTPITLLEEARRKGRLDIEEVLIQAGGADEKFLKDIEIQKKEIMLMKLIGHTFEFDLVIPTSSGNLLKLESMSGEQRDVVYAYLYDITKAFFLENTENIDKKYILSALNNSVWKKPNPYQLFLTTEIDRIIDRISQPNETIIIHESCNQHAIDVIFSDNYLIICNKGPRKHRANQIEAYKINRRAPNIEIILKNLQSSNLWPLQIFYDELPKAFQGEKDWICNALSSLITSDQVVGNCGWESPETGIEALIGLDYLLKHQNLQDEDESKVREALDRDVHKVMESWREYAKRYVLDKYEEFYREHPEMNMNKDLYQEAKDRLGLF